jgi:hypothetical protein
MWIRRTSVVLLGLTSIQLSAQERGTGAHGPIIDAHWHTTLAPGDLQAPQAIARRREAIRAMDALAVRYVVVSGTADALAVWREELGTG